MHNFKDRITFIHLHHTGKVAIISDRYFKIKTKIIKTFCMARYHERLVNVLAICLNWPLNRVIECKIKVFLMFPSSLILTDGAIQQLGLLELTELNKRHKTTNNCVTEYLVL